MNIKNIFIALALTFVSVPALADSNSSANASNQTTSTSQAGAVNGGQTNQQVFNTYNPDKLKNVPGFANGSFGNSFSSDYCSGTMQGNAVFAGWGFGGGKQVQEESCVILRASDMTMRISGVKRATSTEMWKIYRSLTEESEAIHSKYNAEVASIQAKPTQKITVVNGKVVPTVAENLPKAPDTSVIDSQASDILAAAHQKALEADKLELASVANICSINDKIRNNMIKAGVDCGQ